MTPCEIARGYIGTTEGPGPENNPVIMEMYASVGHDWVEHDSVAWCAAFVGHCLERAGIRSTRQLTARSYLDWGVPVEIAEAQPGDIGIIPRGTSSWQGHVFFIDRIEGQWVWGLGGNQDDAVNVKRYPVAKLLGVRRAGNVAPSVMLSVEAVQRRLKDLGYHEVGQIDGKIGPRTRAAILAFRHDNDLALVPIIDVALTDALTTARPRSVAIDRATGSPEGSRILAASNAQIALGAAGYAGIAISDVAPLVGQAEEGRDLATRLLDLLGLGSHAPVVMPLLGAAIFLAVIVLAWKARAARIEDHRTGRTP
ncbi:TIGR02594 family protein [Roseicyclus marinus]|uniref:Peptidoglycan binding-like domain-containing protein n=1 Tax=Roseicyclus marinus TaxID=2161673 RepID=A0AA48KLR7_9RHOB|nr:hypothetical protein MACH21_26070 [Roseicyclus marinus]